MPLHPKVLELRNKVGYKPIYHFTPSKKAWDKKPLEQRSIKVSDTDGERLIKQYFCIFGIPDDYGMVPVKGCFEKSLQERGPKSTGSFKIPVLNQHDQKDPLCIPNILHEDEIGLYAEYEPDPMSSGDRLLMQVRRGTINNGSYGFHYVWDKMEFDETSGFVFAKEVELFEVSPVTIGSQTDTFVIRNKDGIVEDKYLEDETEDFIKQIPRKHHLELRTLITRHISLAKMQPAEQSGKPLDKRKPKQGSLDIKSLLKILENEENLF